MGNYFANNKRQTFPNFEILKYFEKAINVKYKMIFYKICTLYAIKKDTTQEFVFSLKSSSNTLQGKYENFPTLHTILKLKYLLRGSIFTTKFDSKAKLNRMYDTEID